MKTQMTHEPQVVQVLAQVAAATSLAASILSWLPVLCAVPAALYYCMLGIEKWTGRKFSDIIKGTK